MGCGCTQKAKIRSAVAEQFRKSGGKTSIDVANVVEEIRKKRLAKIEYMERQKRQRQNGERVTMSV